MTPRGDLDVGRNVRQGFLAGRTFMWRRFFSMVIPPQLCVAGSPARPADIVVDAKCVQEPIHSMLVRDRDHVDPLVDLPSLFVV